MEVLVNKSYLFLRTNQIQNSDIAIARSEKKKKKIEEESGSESEGMNIKLEQFLPGIEIKEIIFISDNESQDNLKVTSKSLFW